MRAASRRLLQPPTAEELPLSNLPLWCQILLGIYAVALPVFAYTWWKQRAGQDPGVVPFVITSLCISSVAILIAAIAGAICVFYMIVASGVAKLLPAKANKKTRQDEKSEEQVLAPSHS